MKKFLAFTLSILALFLLAFGIFLYMLFRPVSTMEGPKASYRVEEGSVEVFSLKNGEAQSLLGLVNPGETLVAPTVSTASMEIPSWLRTLISPMAPKVPKVPGGATVSQTSLEVPFWLNWVEPVVVDAVGRARYFMYKEGKKTKYSDFTVGYTNQTIRKGFIRELERTRILKNIELDFLPGGFSFFSQVMGISISGQGVVSTPEGEADRLLLRLKWLKIGSFTVPDNGLRAIENLFANAYVQSGNFPIKLLRITFQDKLMVMSFRKTAGSDTGVLN